MKSLSDKWNLLMVVVSLQTAYDSHSDVTTEVKMWAITFPTAKRPKSSFPPFFSFLKTWFSSVNLSVFDIIFPSETRSCFLGWTLCQRFPGRPEHPIHPPALPVHTDVWGSRQRKHSSETAPAWVSTHNAHRGSNITCDDSIKSFHFRVPGWMVSPAFILHCLSLAFRVSRVMVFGLKTI